MPDTQHPDKPAEPSIEALIAFERRWPGNGPRKYDAIRAELGITEVRYAVLLARAIDTDEALTVDPVFVHHLRARRDRANRNRVNLLRNFS